MSHPAKPRSIAAARAAATSIPGGLGLPTLIIASLALVAMLLQASPAAAIFGFGDSHELVKPVDGVVSIPIAEVADGKAHYYRLDQSGKEINFFVIKSADGVYRAAFDACDVCFPSRKGYAQNGDFMVCQNCGQQFHSTRINVVKGGCNPAPLNRVYDDQNVTIKVADIATGTRYF